MGAAAAAAKSLQSCPTLCDPRDGSPPGSPVPEILQARTLEWVAISFNSWKWKVKAKSLSCVRLSATPWTAAFQAPPSTGFSRQEYWSGVPLPSPKNGRITYRSLRVWLLLKKSKVLATTLGLPSHRSVERAEVDPWTEYRFYWCLQVLTLPVVSASVSSHLLCPGWHVVVVCSKGESSAQTLLHICLMRAGVWGLFVF